MVEEIGKKSVEDMSIIELKAVLFDIDNEVKQRQAMYQQVGQVLQKKINTQEEVIQEEIIEN